MTNWEEKGRTGRGDVRGDFKEELPAGKENDDVREGWRENNNQLGGRVTTGE